MALFKSGPSVFQSMKAYIQGLDSTLTDFNVGSTLFDLFTSISRSIGDLYTQLKNVSDAAYLMTAQGTDLDLKVADYGLARKAASNASGTITLYRGSSYGQDISIPSGTMVQTPTTEYTAGVFYQLTSTVVLPALINDESLVYISGTEAYEFATRFIGEIISVTGTEATSGFIEFQQNVDYVLNTSSTVRHRLQWLGNATPMNSTYFYVSYKPLSIDAEISAVLAGSSGNAKTGAITVIPTPPAGIDYVKNYNAVGGGTDAESDDLLRNRVPFYLNSLARAVKDAILQQALSVPGVVAASVYEPDPPTGYITLYIDDGSGSASDALLLKVRDLLYGEVNGVPVFENASYKAAGIYLQITSPTAVLVPVVGTVYINNTYNSATVVDEVKGVITDLFSSLKTGESIIRAKLIEVIMGVTGVVNVDVTTLEINGLLEGDFAASSNEVLRAGVLDITGVYVYTREV